MRKLERNKMVKDAVTIRPDLSLTDIGKLFGISPSRVSRISGGVRKRKSEVENDS